MTVLEAKQDVRIRVGGEKVDLLEGDTIEASDQEVNFYLINWFKKIDEASTWSRVLKTSNKELEAYLKKKEQEREDNAKMEAEAKKNAEKKEEIDPELVSLQQEYTAVFGKTPWPRYYNDKERLIKKLDWEKKEEVEEEEEEVPEVLTE